MRSQLHAYLNFKDNARQAMEFYQSVFGGKLEIDTFKQFHVSDDPSEDDKIMHSMLEAENGISFMAADTPNSMEYPSETHFTLALSGDNETELRGYYDKLSAGGLVTMPLEKAPWGDTFGQCVDPFGVTWLVNISPPQA